MQRIHLVVPSFAPTARTDNRQFATVYGEGLRVGDEVTADCGGAVGYRGEIYQMKSGTTAVGYAFLRYVGDGAADGRGGGQGERLDHAPQGGRGPEYFKEQEDIPCGGGMGEGGSSSSGGGGTPPPPLPPDTLPPPPPPPPPAP